MRLLNVLASLDRSFGGPIDGALELAEVWRAHGHEVAFATLDHPDAPYLAATPYAVAAKGQFGGPALISGRNLSFAQRLGLSPDLVPWLRENIGGFDAIVVHGLWNYTTLAARRALVGSGVPYFVFPHGCLDPWFRQTYPVKHLAKRLVWQVSEGPLLNHADGVLFTTEEELRLADGAFWPYRIRPAVVGFGSSKDMGDAAQHAALFRRSVPALGARRFLLYLSRIHPKKGVDLLIDSFAKSASAHPDLDLVIAGPDSVGWRAGLERSVAAHGIAARVHWTGMIDGPTKWGAFHACDAFVLPSHSENFGIVVAEALSCGKPVLLTRRVNLWREVEAGGAGVVDEDTPDGIDSLLARFLDLGQEALKEMGDDARATYEEHFRYERTAERILELVKITKRRTQDA